MAMANDGDCTIPLMGYEAITAAIADSSDGNLTVSVEDLKKITSEKVIEIYKALLFSLFERASEQISQAPYRELAERIKDGCLYEDAMLLSTLCLALIRVFQACCINSFGIRDLVNPKPKRTHRLLSSLLNYIRHVHSKQDIVEESLNYACEYEQKRAEMLSNRDELIQQNEDIEIRIAEQGSKTAKLKPEAEAWRTRLNDLTTLQSEKKKEFEEDQRHLTDKKIILDILKTENDWNEKTPVAMERTNLLNKLHYKRVQLQQLDEDSKAALKLITGFDSLLVKNGGRVKDLEEFRDKVCSLEQACQNVAAQIQNMRRQFNSKRDRLTRIQLQSRKRLSATNELATLERKKMSSMKTEMETMIKEALATVDVELNEISELIELERQEFEDKAQKASDVYGQILDELDVCHQNYAGRWKKLLSHTYSYDR
ncbi:kinetochore protein Nuf2-like [Rhopilema esculentum]|uniref:kinetochore protein Nuf2-like n=1 Tax=Rhopilema esculentum TaxID=499914 RepID=UPI0031E3F225